jgi:hypothetical protein
VVEVAEIFRHYGPSYREKYADRMLPSHRQAMQAIEQCRTEALGGHVYYCQTCEADRYSYHSCRNRHCPKCQHERTQQWLDNQQELLLPVPYFLITFTLPDGLRKVARSQHTLIYNLLFRTSAAAAQHLAQDPRFVGGQIGMLGILHTWGRNLTYHPHVHYLVPAGGLAEDGKTWLAARKSFLFPVKALSRIFRGKFRDALRQTDYFENVSAKVWKQEWVVHCQPVGNGLAALKYLAPYIFRVAISNNRILKLSAGKVTFGYKDTHTGKTKLCTLTTEEFIRRFLQHVLPKGFVKVRYYGFFSSGLRRRLAAIREQLVDWHSDNLAHLAQSDPDDLSDNQQAQAPGCDPGMRCPTCGRVMQLRQVIRPNGRPPP